MKITLRQLKTIIKEEVIRSLRESQESGLVINRAEVGEVMNDPETRTMQAEIEVDGKVGEKKFNTAVAFMTFSQADEEIVNRVKENIESFFEEDELVLNVEDVENALEPFMKGIQDSLQQEQKYWDEYREESYY